MNLLSGLVGKNQNCRVGKRYERKIYNFTRISAEEYDCNGVRIYLSMDGNWQSNPVIEDVAFKNEVSRFISKLQLCDVYRACNPVGEFAGTERCKDCGVVK